MSKRFDVLSPRPKKDGGTYWHRVGTAFEGEKGISILFDSLPMVDKDGRCSVSLFEPREKQPAQSGQDRTQSGNDAPTQSRKPAMVGGGAMDDEIPFMAGFR